MTRGAIRDPLELDLAALTADHELTAALRDAGLARLRDLLSASPQRRLEVTAACDPDAVAALHAAVSAVLHRTDGLAVPLPRSLGAPLSELPLNARARRGCRRLGLATLGELLATPSKRLLAVRGLGPSTHRHLLDALHAALCPAQSPRPSRRPGLLAVLDAALGGLDADSRALVTGFLGVGGRPKPVSALAAARHQPPSEICAALEAAAVPLRAAGGTALDDLLQSLARDLAAHDGVLAPAQRSRSDVLGTGVACAAARPDLPLRLAALCRPESWTFDAGRLVGAPLPRVRAWARGLRRGLRVTGLPCRLDRARAALADEDSQPADTQPTDTQPTDTQPTDAQLDHVLRAHLGRRLQFDPRGTVHIVARRSAAADRLEALLVDAGTPLHLDDLLFRYRDCHASARRSRLHEVLRADRRFLEIGELRFDLRSRHLDELEVARPLAERICARIVATGHRTTVSTALDEPQSPSERTVHLVTDLLRQDRQIRYLGNGAFCPRHRRGSPLVAELVGELRRAMGEVPFARFLQNQEPRRRQLISRLLRENRRFVFPTRDRVDLLENYPFNAERLRLLLRETSVTLDEAGGHAPLDRVRAAVEDAGLGGCFLTDHLLLDLLRRHGEFEILPGPVLAQPDLQLGAWIQRAARDVLRTMRESMSAQQLLAACPELAEFDGALEAMLDLDPLIQSADGLHYELS